MHRHLESLLLWAFFCEASYGFAARLRPRLKRVVLKRVVDSGKKQTALALIPDAGEEEPDLFDYFDPLRSPHAYPNGISPLQKPQEPVKSKPKASSQFGINYRSELKIEAETPTVTPPGMQPDSTIPEYVGEPDLFEYFDPLRSPHDYPNGIIPASNQVQQVHDTDDRYDPLQLPNYSENQNTASPPGGKIGILLMDHGSRNAASNERLQHLAEVYQLTLADSNIVVKAAHMEIASPTIPEGLQELLLAEVDEIICHPYFLSPGRHVREDIPEIVGKAIRSLEIQIPVTTTDPIGSKTQIMVGAIHSLVRESSILLSKRRP